MSLWRRIALEMMPDEESNIKFALNIHELWGRLHHALSQWDLTIVSHRRSLSQLGAYCDWYLSKYENNADLFTAFCYAFAEHLETADVAKLSEFIQQGTRELIARCRTANEERLTAKTHKPQYR